MLAQKDRYFRKILNSADLALADGVGLLWVSKVLTRLDLVRQPILKERVAGKEVMHELIRIAAERRWRVMLVGGRPGVAEKAVEDLRSRIQGLSIQASSGARDIRSETDEERQKVVAEKNRCKPDLLFVAYGSPWHEKWLYQNLDKLDVNVAMVVGGALDMIVDPSLRPPRFMTRLGLNRFCRLLRQPWRIKRQLALARFVLLLLKHRYSS